jgi:hypothetical protein
VWLPWDIAAWCAAVVGVTSFVVRPTTRLGAQTRAVLREVAIATALYAVWRLCGEITVMGAEGARSRGLSIWHFQRWLHLPSELTLQQWTLHALWLIRFANLYYIIFHVAPVGVFLVWLFFRHRDQYPTWRNLLFFISIVCALIQLVPVAPPRLFPELGFVDTGAVYGPRVYDSGEGGQLAAMPSLHVGWAVLIGIAVVMVSTSKWRWLVLAHPVLTVFAVTVTAYHWLLDGIVAVAILLLGMAGERWIRQTRERRRLTSVVQVRDIDVPTATSRT